MRNMKFSPLCQAFASGVLVFAGGCAGLGLGGLLGSGTGDGDASEQSGSPADRECDVPFKPFTEGDSWTIASDSSPSEGQVGVMIGGFGSEIQSLVVGMATAFGIDEQQGCFLAESEISVRFDGNEITVAGAAADDAVDDTCAIELRGTIAQCATTLFLGPGLDVFDMTVEGHVTVAGERAEIGMLQLMRIQVPEAIPCEEVRTTLAEMYWSLSSSNPLAFFGPPPSDDMFVNISGTDTIVEFVSIFESAGLDQSLDAEPLLDCFGEAPEASVLFDGDVLTVTLQIEERAEQFEEEFFHVSDPCSLSFAGEVADCSLLGQFGGSGSDVGQVLRIEGEGTYASADHEGLITTLYLMIEPPHIRSPE